MHPTTRLPYAVNLYPTYLVAYLNRDYVTFRGKRNRHKLKWGRNSTKNTELNKNAKRKIKVATSFLIGRSKLQNVYCSELQRLVKFRVNFITLTLSAKQSHPDTEIKKKCLEPFLKYLRDSKGLKDYIWKAERQDNGNIHFHITTNKYVYYRSVQNKWNQLQNRLGYVDKFYFKYGHSHPHSTEVKAVRRVKNIDSYLSKYISKKGKGKPIQGNNYGISTALRKCTAIRYEEYTEPYEKLLKWVGNNTGFEFHDDYFSIVKFKRPLLDTGKFVNST